MGGLKEIGGDICKDNEKSKEFRICITQTQKKR
jgi:hypothetical protein